MPTLRALLFASLVFAAVPALACPITVSQPMKYAFKIAPIAFEGILESIDADGTLHFRVLKQWKGAPTEEAAVTNPPTSCGYHGARVGSRYVVVPKYDGSIDLGSNIGSGDKADRMERILDQRSKWWRCPLSSFTLYAIVRRLAA
jgi:hypothetical protein